jgi:anti-anti-sigma factor
MSATKPAARVKSDPRSRRRPSTRDIRLGQDLLKQILREIPAGVIIVKAPSGKIVFSNAHAERIWRLTFDSIESVEDYGKIPAFHSGGSPYLPDEWPMARALRTGEAVMGEQMLFRRGGGPLGTMEVNSVPLRNHRGRVIAGVTTFRDITDRKIAEAAKLRLAAIVESSEDAILSETLDGTIRSWNSAAEKLYGYSAEEIVGRPVSLLAPADRSREITRILDKLKQGQHIDHFETVRVKKDGTTINVSLSVSPVRDAAGMIIEASSVAREITPQKRAEAERARLVEGERAAWEAAERAANRTARLQDVTAALSGAATPAQVADVILTQGMLTTGAFVGVVALLADDSSAMEIVHASGLPFDVLERWRRTHLSSDTAIAEAARTRAPVFLESKEAYVARYPPRLEEQAGFYYGAHVALPLLMEHRLLGGLTFLFEEPRTFADHDRGFLVALAQQCAQALERSQLYEHEHRIALALQQAFLPAGLPEVPGAGIHAAYIPGATESVVGGDWYDVFELPDGRVALSVGDVVGRGLHAAAIMGQVRQSIRAMVLEGHAVSAVLERASRVLKLAYKAEGMATAIFGLFDPSTLSFTYSSMGHPGPLIATSDGRVESLPSGSLPMGIDNGHEPPSWTVPLSPSSLLLLYTDGLVEATHNIAEGEAALAAAAREECAHPSPDPARAILNHVLASKRPPDDVAIVTLSVAGAPVDSLRMQVPARPSSLVVVRRSFRRFAHDLGIPDHRIYAMQVALGEALSNVIEHAYAAETGSIDIRAWHGDHILTIAVEDHGQWRPEQLEARGYGLLIMRTLADAFEIIRNLASTEIRLSFVLPEVPPASATLATVSPSGERARAEAGATSATAEPKDFEIQLIRDIPVVDVSGEIDLGNVLRFETVLHEAAGSHEDIVVSLAQVSYLDSRAIHVLFRFGGFLVTMRKRLRLVLPRDHSLRRALAVTGLLDTFPVFESVKEAVGDAHRPSS